MLNDVIVGSMFVGKTKRLIKYYWDLEKDNKKRLLLNLFIDKRYGQTEIVSHDNEKFCSGSEEVKEIRQFLDKEIVERKK